MFKKIVVPLDGSRCAERACEIALNLAKGESAEIAFCSIADPAVTVGTAPPSPALDLLLVERENEAHHLVEVAIEKARRAGLPVVGESHLGVPIDEIVRFAEREKADAIVMGTHGRTGLKRILLGSVAEGVMRKARCPVIVVRDLDHQEHGSKASTAAQAQPSATPA
jgi:nucleotide-binding universal stress UspA family protein